MSDLANLRLKSIGLYFKYKNRQLSLENYINQIKPIDKQIDELELKTLSCYLVDSSVLQKASSKHLH